MEILPPKFSISLLAACLIGLFFFSCQQAENSYQIEFPNGLAENQPLWLAIPYQGDFVKVSATDTSIPSAIAEYIPTDSAYLVYLTKDIESSSSLHLRISPTSMEGEDRISWQETDSTLTAFSDKNILTFHSEIVQPPSHMPDYYARGGHIHPVYSPNGAIITDGFPEGHSHQHGLFFAWVKCLYKGKPVDFWNQHNLTGDVLLDSLIQVKEYHGMLSLKSRQSYVSLEDGPVLSEVLQLKVYPHPSYGIWDISVHQTNVGTDTLFLLEHVYGGAGVRGSKHWNEQDSLHFRSEAKFLTSEGLEKESANHTRPIWTAMYGEVGERMVGIAAFDHPDNPRSPTPVRVHPTMPYFSMAPPVIGDFHIPPGGSYQMSFRFISFDGNPDPNALQKISEVWSASPIILTSKN